MTAPPLTPEAQAAHEALHGIDRCPNCSSVLDRGKSVLAANAGDGLNYFGHAMNGCMLVTLVSIVCDRGEKTEDELYRLFVDCDSEALWDALAPVINKLEDGEFST